MYLAEYQKYVEESVIYDKSYRIIICVDVYKRQMQDTCRRLTIRIGIITVPVEYAQPVCDQFVESGVLAVWNFAPVHLKVPEHILVQNENMAASLAVLSNRLKAKIAEKPAV